MDIDRFRYFESSENLKYVWNQKFARKLSTARSREISACLTQAREFFTAAADAGTGIRPLVQYYGILALSRALVMFERGAALSTLSAGHGLRDVSAAGCRLADLKVKIERTGTFSEFNDEAAARNRAKLYSRTFEPRHIPVLTAASNQVAGMELTLKDVLSRIPDLSDLFRQTFREPAQVESIDLFSPVEPHGRFTMRLIERAPFADRAGLVEKIEHWRARFPWLKEWTVVSAENAWGNAFIHVSNVKIDVDNLAVDVLIETDSGFALARHISPQDAQIVPLSEALFGIGGGYSAGAMYALAPMNDKFFSEFSLIYLGLFLLSSLVRYRPDVWMHAVSRSSLQDRPVDDYMLAIIHRFLSSSVEQFCSYAFDQIDFEGDLHRQPFVL